MATTQDISFPDLEPDPELARAIGERLLGSAKQAADLIGQRVRAVLRPDDPAAAPLRVLCVDDHPDAADSLAAVLGLLGCDAQVAYDGPSALEEFRRARPDTCLIDLAMPGLDGVELALRLRAEAGPRPLLLVAVTALGSVEDRTRTCLAGFHHHLVKPADAPAVVAALAPFARRLGRPIGVAEDQDGG